jgi:hypothetical protein
MEKKKKSKIIRTFKKVDKQLKKKKSSYQLKSPGRGRSRNADKDLGNALFGR